MYIRVKICGITSAADAVAAVDCGAAALGLVFHAPSSRAVTSEQARAVAAATPPFVTLTGVFVDADAQTVRATMDAVRLNCLQFHGAESADFCRSFGLPYIKAVRLSDDAVRIEDCERQYRCARALLADSGSKQQPGGTGNTFDWSLLPPAQRRTLPLVLAGGLDAGNVAAALHAVRPCAVDVSTAVESAPGVKDASKIKTFIDAVNAVSAATEATPYAIRGVA